MTHTNSTDTNSFDGFSGKLVATFLKATQSVGALTILASNPDQNGFLAGAFYVGAAYILGSLSSASFPPQDTPNFALERMKSTLKEGVKHLNPVRALR